MEGSPIDLVILGSTGSIGRQALEVVRANPERFRIVGLGAGEDGDTLRAQALEFRVDHTGLGSEAAVELARNSDAGVVLNAIVGAAGLTASLAALEAGKTLALANKESLVAGGRLCIRAAERGGGRIVPVDSEHAAISQILAGRDPTSVTRIVITASGGPFRNRANLDGVTRDEALAHPTWSMGPKITIDSATMMNKGLEVIEAHFLFGLAFDRIDVLVHPQSIVHGIVEFADGSLLMQAAAPDMRIPTQAALAGSHGEEASWRRLDLTEVGRLEFEPLDPNRFPAVDLAYRAGREGATYPAVLNAANEAAVHSFLAGRIGFTAIERTVAAVLDVHAPGSDEDLESVLEADRWARSEAAGIIQSRVREPAGGTA